MRPIGSNESPGAGKALHVGRPEYPEPTERDTSNLGPNPC